MNDAPVYRWSARQAVSAMSAGQITAVEYAQSLLERAEAHSTLNAFVTLENEHVLAEACLLYTSPSPRDQRGSRMPSSA